VHTAADMTERGGREARVGRVRDRRMRRTTIEGVRGRGAADGWLVLVVAVSLGLRLPFIGVPLNADEGGYAYVAQRWLDGRGHLYDDLWISRPQGIFLAYGVIFRTLGTTVEAIHLGAWVVGLATTLFVWLFARDWLGRRAGIAAALVFTLINGSPYLEGYTANAEVFMALPAAAAAWLLLRWARRGGGRGTLVAVGMLAATATLLKPSGVVMLPVAIGFVWLADGVSWRVTSARWGWLCGGFALGMVPALIHGWLVGWHDFVYASFTYRLEYQSSATATWAHHWARLIRLVRHCRTLVMAVGLLAGIRWAAALSWPPVPAPWAASREAGLVAVPRLYGRPEARTEAETGGLLLRLWLLGCLAGIAMGGDWWFHYLIQIAAPLALWLVASLGDLNGVVSRAWRQGITLAIVALLIGPYWVVVIGGPNEISTWLYHRADVVAAGEVADYLKARSPAEASVYVAFCEPSISYLADRPSPYRYMYPQELAAIPHVEADLIAMIEAPTRPLYIVDTGRGAPFADDGRAFWTAVASRYHLEATVGGLGLYRANDEGSGR
jgi:4-amino-4-deoxy-L-arabinose transferase-like glycosyltransferase